MATIVAASAASAQHPIVLQKLKQWDDAAPQPSREQLLAEVKRTELQVYPDNPQCRDTSPQIGEIMPATSDRFVFTGIVQGRVRNGWTLLVTHPECDAAPVRYLAVQYANGSLTTTRINRGESLAHDSLIADTLPLAAIQAAATLTRAGNQCDMAASKRLGVIRLREQDPDPGQAHYGVRYSGSWSEVWPIEICERTVEVVVRFTADGDGGAYNSIPGDLAKILPDTAP